METMTQRTKLKIRHTAELPPPTAQEIAWEKDPDTQERREFQKLWKEERAEFARLERLTRDLKIKRVIVTPDSPSSILGRYLPDGDWESTLAQEWGLSKKQENLILKSGPTILICRYALHEGVCRFLAHEIGHHICRIAKFDPEQENTPVTKTMGRFFPDNSYLKNQNTQDEFRSECFAEYLTVFALRRGIERECEAILGRARRHNPDAAKLVKQYRTTLLERTS